MPKNTRNIELTKMRDRELLMICKDIIQQLLNDNQKVNMFAVARLASTYPASRFWISEERAKVVLKAWCYHDEEGVPYPYYADPETMSHQHRAMFREIYSRYKLLKQKFPSRDTDSIVYQVVNSPAPSLYLDPKSILVYFYSCKRKIDHEKKRIPSAS